MLVYVDKIPRPTKRRTEREFRSIYGEANDDGRDSWQPWIFSESPCHQWTAGDDCGARGGGDQADCTDAGGNGSRRRRDVRGCEEMRGAIQKACAADRRDHHYAA